jgi:hypothetical protein
MSTRIDDISAHGGVAVQQGLAPDPRYARAGEAHDVVPAGVAVMRIDVQGPLNVMIC